MAVQLSACSSCALVLASTGCDAPLLEAGGTVGLMTALASYPTNQRLVGAPGCQPVSSTSCWTNPWKASCCRSLIGCRSGIARIGGLGPVVRTLPLCSTAICCMKRCRWTPQVFPADLLRNAYNAPFQDAFTDDASVAEMDGVQIKLTEGDEMNIKVTTPFDLKMANFMLSEKPA